MAVKAAKCNCVDVPLYLLLFPSIFSPFPHLPFFPLPSPLLCPCFPFHFLFFFALCPCSYVPFRSLSLPDPLSVFLVLSIFLLFFLSTSSIPYFSPPFSPIYFFSSPFSFRPILSLQPSSLPLPSIYHMFIFLYFLLSPSSSFLPHSLPPIISLILDRSSSRTLLPNQQLDHLPPFLPSPYPSPSISSSFLAYKTFRPIHITPSPYSSRIFCIS